MVSFSAIFDGRDVWVIEQPESTDVQAGPRTIFGDADHMEVSDRSRGFHNKVRVALDGRRWDYLGEGEDLPPWAEIRIRQARPRAPINIATPMPPNPDDEGAFYGADQAAIHHSDFGLLARDGANLLLSLLEQSGVREGTVVDLGSGSRILARIVSEAGFDVLGIDISPDMVEIATRHAPKATFRCGSLLDADLLPAVAVTALGEALNYATDPRAGPAELERLARRVHKALGPRGVFLFDVATPGREGPARTRQQFHDRDEWTLYMRTQESEDGKALDRFITIFRRVADGTYRRTDEHHLLRLYDPATVARLLGEAGFDVETLEVYPSDSLPPKPLAGWKVFVARPRDGSS
jgi:SAM-dependent methyltransferase